MAQRKPKDLSSQLRAAINASPMTRYRICKLTGISQSGMSRFMAGEGGLTLAALDRIAMLLELGITWKTKSKDRKEGK